VAVCPRFGIGSYQSAAIYPSSTFGNNNNQKPYLRFEITAGNAGNMINMTTGLCYPAALKAYKTVTQGISVGYPLANGSMTISNLNTTWMTFYTDSNCTASFSSPATIPQGTSSQTVSLWAKASAPGTGLQFSPTISSSDSVEFSASTNTVNVAAQLQVSAPYVMVNDTVGTSPRVCYTVSVARVDGTGQPINSDPSALTVNYNMNSGFQYYPNYSNCNNLTNGTTTGSFLIPANSSNANFYVRRTIGDASPQNMNFSAAGYSSVTFTSSGSGGAAVGTRLVISPANSFELGKCSAFVVKHVNSNGDELPVLSPMGVQIIPSAPEAQIFNDGNCSSSQSVFSLGIGNSRFNFFVQMNTSGSVTFSANGGAISGVTASLTAAPSTQPYLTFALPKIKSLALGSHDGFPRTFTLIVFNPISDVVCEQAPGTTFSSWSSCAGQFNPTTNVFSWTATDATANIGFRFGLQSGGPMIYYYFIPGRLYSRVGQQFTVYNCDNVVAASGSSGFTDISNATGPTICLGSGSFAGGTADTLNMSTKKIIGSTMANGDPGSTLTSFANDHMFESAGNTMVANLNFSSPGSGSGGLSYLRSINGSGIINSFNNKYQTDSFVQYGIQRVSTSSPNISSVNDRFTVDGSSSASYGAYFSCGTCSGQNTFQDSVFELKSGASSYARGIGIYQSGPTINLKNARMNGANSNGSIIESNQNSSLSYTSTINIESSNFSINGVSNSNRFPIYATEKIVLNIKSTNFISNLAFQQTINTYATAANQQTINIAESKFINYGDISAVFMNTSSAQTISTNRTHFIRTGTAGTGSVAISTSAAHNWSTNSTTTPNDTYFCGVGGTNWNAPWNSTPTGSILTGGTPAVTNNLDASSMMCAQ